MVEWSGLGGGSRSGVLLASKGVSLRGYLSMRCLGDARSVGQDPSPPAVVGWGAKVEPAGRVQGLTALRKQCGVPPPRRPGLLPPSCLPGASEHVPSLLSLPLGSEVTCPLTQELAPEVVGAPPPPEFHVPSVPVWGHWAGFCRISRPHSTLDALPCPCLGKAGWCGEHLLVLGNPAQKSLVVPGEP